MDTATPNVNFPEHLDIAPSTSPTSFRVSSHSEPDEGIFGSLAQQDAISKYGIAGRVWEAAYTLCLYIESPPNLEFDPPFIRENLPQYNRKIVELGSGTGIVSSRVAKHLNSGDTLIVTDLPEVCPLLEKNLQIPRSPSETSNIIMAVRPLAWGDEGHTLLLQSEFIPESGPQPLNALTHIICSDLIYFPELLAPLLRTLLRLTSPPFSMGSAVPNTDVTVIISYKIRSIPKETPFWTSFGLWFSFQPVLVKGRTEGGWQRFGSYSDDPTFIFVAHRRPESLLWTMPPNDRDLLAGRGARGNDSVKEDDTFETLLLMTLE